jgi:hypothetical protein
MRRSLQGILDWQIPSALAKREPPDARITR